MAAAEIERAKGAAALPFPRVSSFAGSQKNLPVTSFLAAHSCGLSPACRVPLHSVPLPSCLRQTSQLANTPAQLRLRSSFASSLSFSNGWKQIVAVRIALFFSEIRKALSAYLRSKHWKTQLIFFPESEAIDNCAESKIETGGSGSCLESCRIAAVPQNIGMDVFFKLETIVVRIWDPSCGCRGGPMS